MRCPDDAPADDVSGEHIDDECHINEPGPGHDISKVRHPQPVRRRGLELPVDAIERTGRAFDADRRALRFAAVNTLQVKITHQPRDCAAGDFNLFPAQLTPDLPRAVDTKILRENA